MAVTFLFIYFFFVLAGILEQERVCISEIMTASGAHLETLESLQKDHSQQSASIEQYAIDTFRQNYMVCPIYILNMVEIVI